MGKAPPLFLVGKTTNRERESVFGKTGRKRELSNQKTLKSLTLLHTGGNTFTENLRKDSGKRGWHLQRKGVMTALTRPRVEEKSALCLTQYDSDDCPIS